MANELYFYSFFGPPWNSCLETGKHFLFSCFGDTLCGLQEATSDCSVPVVSLGGAQGITYGARDLNLLHAKKVQYDLYTPKLGNY